VDAVIPAVRNWQKQRELRRFGTSLARHFDRIYCLNLESRPDRWAYASQHMARFGLRGKVQRFTATDVRNDPQFAAYERRLQDNFSLLAMCGCMLSHRRIIEEAKTSGLNNVLVLEDDFKILEQNIGQVDRTLAELSGHDWDVFYLGATYLWPLTAISPFLVRVQNGAYATHAIAYNAGVFDRILELLPRDPFEYLQTSRFEVNALDKWLQSDLLDHGRFFGSNPIMIVQGLGDSDIASNQKDGIEQIQIELFAKNLDR